MSFKRHFTTRHDYTIGKLDMLQACDACADMGMTYSVIVQCADILYIFVLDVEFKMLFSDVIKTTFLLKFSISIAIKVARRRHNTIAQLPNE